MRDGAVFPAATWFPNRSTSRPSGYLGEEVAGLRRLLLDALEGISFLSDEVSQLREDNERLRKEHSRVAEQQVRIVASLRGELRRRVASKLGERPAKSSTVGHCEFSVRPDTPATSDTTHNTETLPPFTPPPGLQRDSKLRVVDRRETSSANVTEFISKRSDVDSGECTLHEGTVDHESLMPPRALPSSPKLTRRSLEVFSSDGLTEEVPRTALNRNEPQNWTPELQGSWTTNSDEGTSRVHGVRPRRLLSEVRNGKLWLFVLDMMVGTLLAVSLLILFYPDDETPPQDLPEDVHA
ncbi:hypothetical protein HPB50_009241 [Hyalomma asiaticum]|uniref:Uncharacterized protein n=1 Tax=Hyalomma asiaticum TaxID=266040 RepID=A0ACB7TES6_HYAAI|nr:hypothetical protein HPB50_009241 [Hyalomma asiaticum]